MILSLMQVGLCVLAMLPHSISAYSDTEEPTLAFCKTGFVDSSSWYNHSDICYQIKGFKEAKCYATPELFSKKGGSWWYAGGPKWIMCRAYEDAGCQIPNLANQHPTQEYQGNQLTWWNNGNSADLKAFACFGFPFASTAVRDKALLTRTDFYATATLSLSGNSSSSNAVATSESSSSTSSVALGGSQTSGSVAPASATASGVASTSPTGPGAASSSISSGDTSSSGVGLSGAAKTTTSAAISGPSALPDMSTSAGSATTNTGFATVTTGSSSSTSTS